MMVSPASSYTCNWCGLVSDGSSMSCPACGATINVSAIVTPTGWTAAPARKDMAKIQLGKSSVQIEGTYVPVADFNLAAEDSVYFAHHVLLWKENSATISIMPLKGGWKRLMAGMPLLMTQAKGPGHIAFSRDAPGELLSIPLQPGQAVDVREHMFLVATNHVTYDWFNSEIWFDTPTYEDGKTRHEYHYPLGMTMDRFSAPNAPGLLILHASGNVFVRELAPGESILIKPTALIFKDPSVQMMLHFEHPSSGGAGGGLFGLFTSFTLRYLWLRLTGPGRVAIQSAFEPVEDTGANIASHSPATEKRW